MTHGVTRALLLLGGVLGVTAAALYDPGILERLQGQTLAALTRERVHAARLGMALMGVALIAAAEAVRRWSRARDLAARPAIATALLAVLLPGVPLTLLECGMRPFVEPKTTLFVEDPLLGWRLRPGARGEWGAAHVAINGVGLRGPELPHAKPPGVVRILFLGDSVTFGYGIERDADVFPFAVEGELERRLGLVVQTLNAGVGGYSPWQEALYLEREGLRYEPDLIVIGFVLNDVGEKLSLRRFGGSGAGFQLARSARSSWDRRLSASGILWLGRELYARLRFGPDVGAGASRAEVLRIQSLARHPHQPQLAEGWRLAKESLGRIFALAEERSIPCTLALFPYAFQAEAPQATGEPQRIIARFARERGVPVIDLLPALARPPGGAEALFLDSSHLSVSGHRIVASVLAAFFDDRGLLRRAGDESSGR